MKKIYVLSFVLLLSGFLLPGFSNKLHAQHAVAGIVQDTTGDPLPATTVVLLTAKDSTLYKFALTGQDGGFSFTGVATGNYLLQLSFLGYRNVMLPLEVNKSRNLGKITLAEDEVLLQGVKIEAEIIPILFKKDTIEYNADAFKTRPDANVEELLKRLPGVEVESDGTVKAQGETVSKVLVDGKEFFGDDPQVATKNLPANAVDKVQVFDKASEMTEFTGVEDGERVKTINLKLKDGQKAGVFGKVEAGYGTDFGGENDDPFRIKGNLNRFTKKTQLSALGMFNNINEQSFNIQDYANFIGGIGRLFSSGGGRSMRSSGGLPLGGGGLDGIVRTGSGGINFNWDPSPKTKFRSSYFYNGINNRLISSLDRTSFLEGNSFETKSESMEENFSAGHRLDLRFEHNLDSQRVISMNGTVKYQDGWSESFEENQNTGPGGVVISENYTGYDGVGTNLTATGNLIYKRRFDKQGRFFVADFDFNYNNDDKEGLLDSRNTFFSFDTSGTFTTDTILQNQTNLNEQTGYGAKLSYTEPLGKGKYLELRYRRSEYWNQSDKSFYDLEGINSIEVFNQDLSIAYDNRYTVDRGGASLQFNRESLNLNVGANLEYARLNGKVVDTDSTIQRDFLNVLPSLRIRYRLAKTRRLDFRYSTNVQEPTVSQLAPVIDNSNPLFITRGNPDLQASYVHNGRLRFFSFSQFSYTSIFAMLSGTYTRNPITNELQVDSSLIQISTPVNVDDQWNVNLYGGFSTPIRKLKLKVNLNARSGFTRSIAFVNQRENLTNTFTNSGDFGIENRKKDLFDAIVGVRLSHTFTTYSIDNDLDQSFLTQQYYTELSVNPGKWEFSTKFTYTIFGGAAFEEEQIVPLWEASAGRYFVKGNRLKLAITAFDLLNQNTGVNRTSTANYIEEERFNTLNRYVMFNVTWLLTKFQPEKLPERPWGRRRRR